MRSSVPQQHLTKSTITLSLINYHKALFTISNTQYHVAELFLACTRQTVTDNVHCEIINCSL